MRYALIAVAIGAGLIFARLAWIFLLRGLASPSESAAGLEGDYLVFSIFGVSTLLMVVAAGGLIQQRDWGAYLLSTAGFLWSLPLVLAFRAVIQVTESTPPPPVRYTPTSRPRTVRILTR